MKKAFAVISMCVLVLGPWRPVSGAVITVPGDYDYIQDAIAAALAGDTVLVANGVYTGAGNKNLDFDGKAITVRSQNGPENCIIDCESNGRAFLFRNGETTTTVLVTPNYK